MKKGFTMFMNGKDYFFVTTCKSTNSKILLEKVCSYFNAPMNDNNIKFLKSKLSFATLEYKDYCFVINTANGSIVTPYNDASIQIVSFTQKNRNLATKENIDRIKKALNEAKALYNMNPSLYHVHISIDNSKTGDTASVSIVPYIFCPACAKETCGNVCYAFAMALNDAHPDVLKSWAMNTAILLTDPEKYHREVSAAVGKYENFRYHVSGEIIDKKYLYEVVNTAETNPGTDILIFTKQYNIVNEYIEKHGGSYEAAFPENLKLLFSKWEKDIPNPYNVPTTDVLNETEKPKKPGFICRGNCKFCAKKRIGCWTLKKGETVYFYKH